jgi:hypothetical protein
VLSIEKEFLEKQVFVMSNFLIKLQKYYQVFPEILALFREIEEEELSGGSLLNRLLERSKNGD